MSAWQPISTAPKDRTVLIFRKGNRNADCVAMAMLIHRYGHPIDVYEWTETIGGYYRYWGLNCDEGSEVTHWQPLPDPPEL